MNEWISINERFPHKGQQVLVWFANSPEPYIDCWTFDNSNQYFRDFKPARGDMNVTHWMPLPEPPKETV